MEVGRTINQVQCGVCGGRMRNAFFCSVCGRSLCCWDCYRAHVANHPPAFGRDSSEQTRGNGRRDRR
jgi:hypothetical protein